MTLYSILVALHLIHTSSLLAPSDSPLIGQKPLLPTGNVMAKWDEVRTAIAALLELKKHVEKLEHELKAMHARKAQLESGSALGSVLNSPDAFSPVSLSAETGEGAIAATGPGRPPRKASDDLASPNKRKRE